MPDSDWDTLSDVHSDVSTLSDSECDDSCCNTLQQPNPSAPHKRVIKTQDEIAKLKQLHGDKDEEILSLRSELAEKGRIHETYVSKTIRHSRSIVDLLLQERRKNAEQAKRFRQGENAQNSMIEAARNHSQLRVREVTEQHRKAADELVVCRRKIETLEKAHEDKDEEIRNMGIKLQQIRDEKVAVVQRNYILENQRQSQGVEMQQRLQKSIDTVVILRDEKCDLQRKLRCFEEANSKLANQLNNYQEKIHLAVSLDQQHNQKQIKSLERQIFVLRAKLCNSKSLRVEIQPQCKAFENSLATQNKLPHEKNDNSMQIQHDRELRSSLAGFELFRQMNEAEDELCDCECTCPCECDYEDLDDCECPCRGTCEHDEDCGVEEYEGDDEKENESEVQHLPELNENGICGDDADRSTHPVLDSKAKAQSPGRPVPGTRS